MKKEIKTENKYLSRKEVCALFGIGSTTFYSLIKREDFSKSCAFGGRVYRWKKSELEYLADTNRREQSDWKNEKDTLYEARKLIADAINETGNENAKKAWMLINSIIDQRLAFATRRNAE